jgi:mannose-1-phosphate guanylyltransferase
LPHGARRSRAPAPRDLPWRALRLRALVLAAGLGTRLRPLSERIPKPLLPVLGAPVLGHTLRRLAAIGCEAVAINLHHLGQQIRDALGSAYDGMPLEYSAEPELLGTLGAFRPLRGFFAPADLVILINGDSLCRWPLARLLRRHLASAAEATLLLATRPDPAGFGGGVAVDRSGAVLGFRRGDPLAVPAAARHVFAGAHVFAPALLGRIGPGSADIVRDLYVPLLAEGRRIDSVVTRESWHDLGTPRRFLTAVLDRAGGARAGRDGGAALWTGRNVHLAAGASAAGSVLESGVEIGAGSEVAGSVLLPGARVGAGARLRGLLIGPGVVVPPGTELEGKLLTATPGGPGMVVSPLDPP